MITRASAAALVLFCTFFANARPADAQLGWTYHTLGEFDSNDYWLKFAVESANETVIAAIPSLGLRYGFRNGAISLRAGYTFTDSELKASPGITTDVGAGVVNTVHLEYWGNESLRAEGMVSYHYESENVWTRGGVTRRVPGIGDVGQIHIGAEAAYLNGNGVSSFQPGLLIGLHPAANIRLNLGVGRRFDEGAQATYFRAGLHITRAR
ncbi:MAG: hypothetical protein WEE89_03030 [Gemmatimonadota bacterium]